MIEHFKKFSKGDKKLLPLSFSHLSEFAFYRERWALRRIFGYEFPTSAAAERGKAVESGINLVLNGHDLDKAKKLMYDEYDANCSRINDPNVLIERDNLVPLLELGAYKFQQFAFKWNLIGYQEKIETEIGGIPVIGYTDFKFEDKKTQEEFYLDLKTSKSLPNAISVSHAMQQSIYHRGTNARQMLWYLKNPTKTKGAEWKSLELDNYNFPMTICKHIINVMGNYLSTVNTAEDVKNSLIPNPDSWIWKEKTVYDARNEVWGY